MFEIFHRGRYSLLGIVVLAVLAGSVTKVGQSSFSEEQAMAAVPPALDDEVVLPSRVSAAMDRTASALDRSESRIDDQQYGSAAASLSALEADLVRTYNAANVQFHAPPTDPEAEATPGPSSVIALLTLEQWAITRLAGLYDRITDPIVLNRLGSALNTALTKRDRMLNAVLKLNPVGAGAAYADGMADSLEGYADEVANLSEAQKFDRLTTSAREALTNALSRSQAAAAKVNAAFGGAD
jgi:hypothetical protein